MSITLVKSNNHFGQHEFHLSDITLDDLKKIITSNKWFKQPRLTESEGIIVLHCLTNYDKATVERIFVNE